MKKTWKRFLAYIIDMLLIISLTQCLSSTTLLNPNLDNYQKYSKEYNKIYTETSSFLIQLQNLYQDKKITQEEYDKLIKKHPTYEEILKENYKNNELSEKNYNKIINQVSKTFTNKTSKLYYLIEKNSISEMIIYTVLTLLYFIGFF